MQMAKKTAQEVQEKSERVVRENNERRTRIGVLEVDRFVPAFRRLESPTRCIE